MQKIQTDVLVIGGGATGLGVLRDLSMRGLRAALVEKGDLTYGTTGRYHGLLHSGGRYVVKDPVSATECAEENAILRRIQAHCIEDTSGFFVITPWDDPSYGDRFLKGCRDTGVPVQELSVAEALRREPLLNPQISRVFEVPDGSADSFLSAIMVARGARQYGGQVLNYHNVVGLILEGERIVGARLENLRSGELVQIDCGYIVNAAGAWAGKIAHLAELDVNVVPGKGTMVAMNHRMVNTVINRCKLPADGDILVPIHTVAVIGTTDMHVPDPDVFGIEQWEIDLMMDEGEKLVPGFKQMRALRAWAGVRPLYKDTAVVDDRDISRAYKLLDHAARDGVEGMASIVGGKWTTYRLMAQEVVDFVAAKLGNSAPCRTHLEVLPGHEDGKLYWLGHRLDEVEEREAYGDLICECELATRQMVVEAIHHEATANLDDIRRAVRLGMGPCQGGFCTYRAAALWLEERELPMRSYSTTNGAGDGAGDGLAPPSANAALRHFLQERWKGLTPVLWADQLKQERLDEIIYLGILGVDLLPEAAGEQQAAIGMVTDNPAIRTEYA
jgi:glycerol-3-phosphate dehydrogenase